MSCLLFSDPVMGYVKKLLSDIKDSPRGWAIVACIFIATVFRFGVIYGIGPIYVALEQEFNTSHELRSMSSIRRYCTLIILVYKDW